MAQKDKWDKFSVISGFFSGIVIAIIGIVFTVNFSDKQTNIAERQTELAEQQILVSQIQALEAFIPYLTDQNTEMRKFASQRIADVAGADYATELEKIANTEELKEVAEEARAKGLGAGQRELPLATVAKVSDAALTKEGWAYLGHFDNGNWVTRYFNFDNNANPPSLMNTTQTVREQTGALNVREGMPDFVGRFPKVIDVLKVGSEVKIVEVKEWHTTGYMWAHVKYSEQ